MSCLRVFNVRTFCPTHPISSPFLYSTLTFSSPLPSSPLPSFPSPLTHSQCAKDFGQQFDGLMSVLGEEGELAEDILRYLTFRLDFNEYHALSKQTR
jgi:hypothetical protein